MALLILVGVPLTSYEEVKATGVEEYLYYTYWDLMNSLYAMTGYDMKISESEIKIMVCQESRPGKTLLLL